MAVRNKVIFVGIAKKMHELGYERDWQQCKVKIKNLKSIYRDIKDHNGETGRGRKTCKFYKELDEILGHRPVSIPPVVLDSARAVKLWMKQVCVCVLFVSTGVYPIHTHIHARTHTHTHTYVHTHTHTHHSRSLVYACVYYVYIYTIYVTFKHLLMFAHAT